MEVLSFGVGGCSSIWLKTRACRHACPASRHQGNCQGTNQLIAPFAPGLPLHATHCRNVIGRNWAQLRLLANEDTSVGLWLLASNVTHFEDMRLCSPRCTPASVGVLRNECAGLCDPLAELPALHANTTCSAPPGPLLRYHASHPEHKAFESMWVP